MALTTYVISKLVIKRYFVAMFTSRVYRYSELIVLSIVIPCGILFFDLSVFVLPFLWAIFLYCLLIFYLFERSIENSNGKEKYISKKIIFFVLFRWLIIVFGLLIFTFYIFPEKLFIVQTTNPGFIWKILVFYPFLSAFPQEFIFCKFFFARYKLFFGEKELMVAMSAVAFCLAHILFINWVAPVLGLFGGIMFARTYKKTKSLLMVSIEHSLYGDALFVLGLGWFFWGGSVG